MKKNLILLGIFLSLLMGAYFLEEIYKKNKAIQNFEQQSLLAKYLKDWREIKLKEVAIQRVSGGVSFLGHDYPVSDAKWRRLIDDLQSIFFISEAVELNSWKSLLEKTHHFTIDERSFEVSQVHPQTGNFIIQDEGQWRLVYSDIAFDGFYQDPIDRKIKAYHEFIKILYARHGAFIDQPLWQYYNLGPLGEVESFTSQKKFNFNFVGRTTIPTAPEALGYDEKYFNDWSQFVTQLSPLGIYSKGSIGDVSLLTSFKISGQKIFFYYSQPLQYYLIGREGDQEYFLVGEKAAEFLTAAPSAFWGKSILAILEQFKSNPLQIEMRSKEISKRFLIRTDQQFAVYDPDKNLKVENESFTHLLCFISACDPRYNYITFVQNGTLKNNKYNIEMRVGNELVKLSADDMKFQMWHEKSKLVFTYIHGGKISFEALIRSIH